MNIEELKEEIKELKLKNDIKDTVIYMLLRMLLKEAQNEK